MSLDFSDIRVLLIGDFMVDQYVLCTSTRMSPEAPVPVLNPDKIYSSPGGAGNVALNLSELGANVTCVGCIGSDSEGIELTKFLEEKGIDTDLLYITGLPTTLKRRYYSNGNQVLRVDFEKEIEDWSPSITDIEYDKYDLIILSDYNKGVLNNGWFSNIKGKNIFVDPKKDDFSFYSNATVITPNINELQRASNSKITDDDSIIKACQLMIQKDSNLKYILAKKGDKGMTIVGKNGFVKHIDAHKVNNPDVTGAGDTVIAAFSLAFAKTNNVEDSARIANAAAAIVVGKTGTATVTIDEINNYIELNK